MIEIGRTLAIAALDLDASDTLQSFDRVGVGQLADILRVDRVDDLIGVSLDRLRRSKALADAGNDDIVGRDTLRSGLKRQDSCYV